MNDITIIIITFLIVLGLCEIVSNICMSKCKNCVVQDEASKYLYNTTCLHCGHGMGRYCEDCYQELLTENIK